VKAQLRSELYKLRSTWTTAGLLAAMLGLILLAVLLHVSTGTTSDLATFSHQKGIMIDVGENVGALFAALAGALSITGEIRHGTIRPTLLVTPRRSRVVAAKIITAALTGAVFGLVATGSAAGVGSLVLANRGLALRLGGGDYALLLVGGAAAAALWAVIGLGAGAIARNQVPTLVGLLAWMLFIENVLLGDVPGVGKFAPGALGQGLAGSSNTGILHTPALAGALLVVWAAAAAIAGRAAITRRDFT
jgi:ABC-2 type transport system permease protein